MDDIAIQVERVSKSFKLPHEKQGSIKGALINFHKRGYEKQEVLKDINFEIKKGEFFGIVGRNGSGKSTLLKLLAGIYTADKGHIQVSGRLTPFIELGVGFNPELTGRENVFLNGALLGFNRKEMTAMYDGIVEFAELERFMDQKLKNYSSGMQVRLAFSIAIRANSDILILDEVLAVGDAIFQKKCYEHFKQLKREKRTVVFVSHDTSALQEYCDRGILLEGGELVFEGGIDSVVNRYIEVLNSRETSAPAHTSPQSEKHIGQGDIRIEQSEITSDGKTQGKSLFTQDNKTLVVTVEYKAAAAVHDPIYGITITDAAGERIFTCNNMWSQRKMKPVEAGQTISVTWKVPNVFATGTFFLTPAVAGAGGAQMYDQVENMLEFQIRKKQISNAMTNLSYDMDVKING